ncbi:MAG TPA: glycogen-binding domain-containing protein [Gemmatimonadaceae bacterium]|nr:glycogen-binding domain-containing protein [Gemmatimonadaceae bacterium]
MVSLATSALAAGPAGAQQRQSSGARAVTTTSLEVGAATVRYDEFLRSGAFTVSPSLRVRRERSLLVARGSASLFQSGSVSAQAELAGSGFTETVRGFSGELSGSLAANGYKSSSFMAVGAAGAYAHYAAARFGAQTGALVGYAPSSFTETVADEPGFVRGLLAAWLRPAVRAAPRLELSAIPTRAGTFRYADLEGTARWTTQRWEVAASAGARSGARTVGSVRRWVDASGAVRLTSHVVLVGGGGSYPPDLAQGIPGARYAALSLRITSRPRLSPAPRATLPPPDALPDADPGFVLLDAEPGSRTIRVRAPSSETSRVELMGDFTAWEPVTLARAADGLWEVTLPLSPGTHRVNVRFDGGDWTVPPGLVSQEDDFGGAVGVFTARE